MIKKKRYFILLGITGLLLIIISLSLLLDRPCSVPFSVRIQRAEGEYVINCWENEEQQLYVFLPGGTDLGDVSLVLQTKTDVVMDGCLLKKETSCGSFEVNVPYEIVYSEWGKAMHKSLVFVQSANVPTVLITTESGNSEYIHMDKDNAESGTFSLYTADGSLDYKGNVASVGGRGNYTWTECDKKSYSLQLEEDVNLLGMGAARRWVLFANATDATHVRNKLVYDFAKEFSLDYAPDCQWVDLYLNGEYSGLYLLCERNEIHNERVNISEEHGVLLSLELEQRLKGRGIQYFNTAEGQTLRVHATEEVAESDLEQLQEIWQSVENAIMAESGVDPVSGKHYLELIDIDSWARKYLIEEVFANLDGCFVSQYFYWDPSIENGKIYAGPVWDYDLSMGNEQEWQLVEPRAIFAGRSLVRGEIFTPWFYELWRKPEFRAYALDIYQIEFKPLLEQWLSQNIEDYMSPIHQAISVDALRWGRDEDEAQQQMTKLKAYLLERMDFLADYWNDEQKYCMVVINGGRNYNYAYQLVLPGESLSFLPELESTATNTFVGWFDAKTDEAFDVQQPITENTEIYAQWINRSSGRFNQIIKLMPLAVIACMGAVVVLIEIVRLKKSGGHR